MSFLMLVRLGSGSGCALHLVLLHVVDLLMMHLIHDCDIILISNHALEVIQKVFILTQLVVLGAEHLFFI